MAPQAGSELDAILDQSEIEAARVENTTTIAETASAIVSMLEHRRTSTADVDAE